VTRLTVGQLAERAGVATSAIRFYEARGLIRSRRTTGNQRRYEQSELRRVAFIRTAQRVGLSLDEIGEALATLPENRVPTKADWTRLSRAWRPRLDEQIQRIERLRDQLDGCIGCGCLSLRNCALRNPGDMVASRGPGAVFLEPQ
jgi:MerR family transcriptional regulator, redox-sensitive transcriptional activator SoxR